MPGARLTIQDREQISAWLDAGLGYAEIARRLGRPTSTISREVARNHDSGDYRASDAQRAATRRAPRRRPATPARPDGFAEEFAVLLAGTGLPKMCARVFACLLVSESGSLTAADLAQRLSVSPASVSKSVGYLEEMDLLSRTPDAGTRRERYVIGDDVWQRAWQTDTGAHAAVAEAARRGVALFGPESPAGIRLHQIGQFFGWLAAQMTRTSGPESAPTGYPTGTSGPPTAHIDQPATISAQPGKEGERAPAPTDQPTGTGRPPTTAADQAAGAGDPLTVLAALIYAARPLSTDEPAAARPLSTDELAAARPLSTDELAAALCWPPERVAACLDTACLTRAQRAALRPHPPESGFTSGRADPV